VLRPPIAAAGTEDRRRYGDRSARSVPGR